MYIYTALQNDVFNIFFEKEPIGGDRWHGTHTHTDKYMSDGLNLLHPRKDMAEMVTVFCVSPIVPEGLVLWTWNEQVIEKKK